MTGPCTSTVHPLPRRPWLLLPLLATVAFLQLGCSSDQPTEPVSTPLAAKVHHPIPKPSASIAMSQSAAAKPLLMISSAVSGDGPSVLILADADFATTTALATSLADSGVQVTVRPAPEYEWDGTNPSLSGFDVVIHLNGASYEAALPTSAQTALTSFVQNGGGFVSAKWNGYDFEFAPDMADLVLQEAGGIPAGDEQNCAACPITYEALSAAAGHPVLAGLPSSFTFTADAHDAGPQVVFASNPSTALMQVSSGRPGVLAREFGSGRIVQFSFAPNYYFDNAGDPHDPETLLDQHIQKLYLNAVRWTAGSSTGTSQPQSITFDPIGDRVYGDPAFDLTASASSGLPVNYTASGTCGVLGVTLTITGAGSCTITAHQAGNDNYEPAADVSRSFTISKAPATILLSGLSYTFDGTVKSATATTSPAGLSGVSVTYSQSGAPAVPRNAGSYQVLASLNHVNYQASPASATLTIAKANPVISWIPASITAGSALTSEQLNASFRGLGGVILTGGRLYTPGMGTSLPAGPATLSVQFTPDDENYAVGNRSVTINVLNGMRFTGFYAPLRNMPAVNVVTAGSSVPFKFSVGGYIGLNILSAEPTSVAVQCGSGPEATMLTNAALTREGLSAAGYSYTYVWKTDPAWAGSCRKFIMTLADGSRHEAMFRFPAKSRQATTARRILLRGR